MKLIFIIIITLCQIKCLAQATTRPNIAVRKFTTPYQKDADDTSHTAYLSVKGVDNYRNDSGGYATLNFVTISYSGKVTGHGSIKTTLAQYSAWPTDGDEINNYPYELVSQVLHRPINSDVELKITVKQR